ncbi:MAG: deaminase [Patescibacteria group bacterium]
MKALIGYFPVIHAGHLELCRRQKPDSLYILGRSFISEFPLLERDLRALSPEKILAEAQAINLAPEIKIIEKDNLSELDNFKEIILSEDEIGEQLKKKYFSGKKVSFDTAFIRWSGMKALSKNVPDSEQTISSEKLDQELIKRAHNGAKRSPDWWRQVGSLIVKDGKVILQSYNKHFPTDNTAYIDGDPRSNFDAGVRIDLSLALHGEASLIAEAAKNGTSLEGANLYVSTFPCPNCAMMIANAGIKKVYYTEGYSLLNAQQTLKNAGVRLIRVIES